MTKTVKRVVLDGLNICHWANHANREPHFSILLTLCLELKGLQIPFLTFFDASTPHVLTTKSVDAYKRILIARPQVFVEVPGKIPRE